MEKTTFYWVFECWTYTESPAYLVYLHNSSIPFSYHVSSLPCILQVFLTANLSMPLGRSEKLFTSLPLFRFFVQISDLRFKERIVSAIERLVVMRFSGKNIELVSETTLQPREIIATEIALHHLPCAVSFTSHYLGSRS